ncbi:hypothetical protein HZF08_03240 [Paenibacillus sp. CGMCC 1.16610]|uniref:Uncharacterized protein n=1 Tax=Paenibacillus anseongense TaxID=2682845 RepID=A0ABW9UAR1_9BACL|nr:hypothetical protein [Paenibacillus anseongense]MBA2937307.1 hypothetical protein [Paenibacillus sp. CGMCC 1.16610]MVQ36365.1 hypothetical protein [Paenibacillus anseongense]
MSDICMKPDKNVQLDSMNQPNLEQNTKTSSTNKKIVPPVDIAEKALNRASELAVIPTIALNPLIYQVVDGLNSNLSEPTRE